MKLGPRQLAWVAEHGFPNGSIAFHLGPVMVAIRLTERFRHNDPLHWRDTVDTDELFPDA